jgi:hypothetical protein
MPCDPKKLRSLADTCNAALFDLHTYMEESGDDFWREVYGHRVRLAVLVDARIRYAEGYKVQSERIIKLAAKAQKEGKV